MKSTKIPAVRNRFCNWRTTVLDSVYADGYLFNIKKQYFWLRYNYSLTIPTKWLKLIFLYQHAKDQLNSSIHSWVTANFKVPWPKTRPLLTMTTQELLKQVLNFLNLYQYAKNQLFHYHSWCTATLSVIGIVTPILQPCSTQYFSIKFQIPWSCITTQKLPYFIILFQRYSWFKNLAICLAKSILAHISGATFFPNMRFVQKYSK